MDVLEFLRSLVSVNTVNDPVRGLKPTIELPEWIKGVLNGFGVESRIVEKNGFYSVYGSLGDGEPVVLFMAHFDTVPVSVGEWQYDPFSLSVVGDRGYGRGAIDDKSNVAAIMGMLEKLVGEQFNGTLVYAFTGDEEIGGRNGAAYVRDLLLKAGLKPKYMSDPFGWAWLKISGSVRIILNL